MTNISSYQTKIEETLNKLIEEGLIEENDDGMIRITEKGVIDLERKIYGNTGVV